jgi:3-hydroxy-9,10-secoandrosta-1,3,5(10)-triene-9,17-dione monooxygenase
MAPILTSEQSVACARALAPVLAARALETEARRALPVANLEALHRTGLFRLLQPARVGGLELDFGVVLEASRALATGCASTAWVYANLASHHWMLGMWPGEAQDEVWGPNPAALIGASLIFPAGRAQLTAGGYRLRGRWGFASGIDVCEWVMLGATVEAGVADEGEYRLFLLPRGDFGINDTWFVSGLAGTGSKEVQVDGVFVPERRTLALRDTRGEATPGSAVNPGPLYRIPLMTTLGHIVAGVPLGVAEAALEAITREGRSRLAAHSGRNVADYEAVQVKIAEASAHIECARRTLAEGCAEIMSRARSNQPPDLLEKARLRRDCAYAARLACAAVDQVFQASGGSALFIHHPVQRAFRDVHAACAHIALNWDAAASLYGRVALGHTGDLPPFER